MINKLTCFIFGHKTSEMVEWGKTGFERVVPFSIIKNGECPRCGKKLK